MDPQPQKGLLALFTMFLFIGLPPGWIYAQGLSSPRIIVANVVALDQPIFHNRLGAVTPQGMIYALRRDVEGCDALMANCRLESEGGLLSPGQVRLRYDKRPRPLVLRMNVGDVLQVNFTNLLAPDRALKNPEQPATRSASIHVVGMQLVDDIKSDGSFVGNNSSSLAEPGENRTYRYFSEREGSYLLYSNGAISGGESALGSLAFGLFGAVNVEPRGAEWFRSQMAHEDLVAAMQDDGQGKLIRTADGHPMINYDVRYPTGRFATTPVLKMLDDTNEIVHSDLNAIITGPDHGYFPEGTYPVSASVVPLLSDDAESRKREEPFREFTVIFHDEVQADQAFPQFRPAMNQAGQDVNPLASVLKGVRDASAVNYGMSGMGAAILANRLGVGPAGDCAECKFEEFFVTSWALGDPALVVDRPASLNVDPVTGRRIGSVLPARKALYPDDPSNVFHSYLNDHVKIRNLHAGGKHHLFHLHGHQWLLTPDDDNSSYRDVQGIGPGAGHTYEISYNGTGNRNLTPGDALLHSQYYPSFAQGMWALWRAHDTFEEGTVTSFDPRDARGAPIPDQGSRALPDGEIVAGTPIPAVVPLPGRPMAPTPGRVQVLKKAGLPGSQIDFLEKDKNPGYPFFIAGVAGHRPPKPPLETIDDGGLPRHVITGGAQGAASTHHAETRLSFDKGLLSVTASFVPEEGTEAENRAMEFHSKRFHPTFFPDGTPAGNPDIPNDPAGFKTNGLPPVRGAPFADPCVDDFGQPAGVSRTIKAAAFQLDVKMNKMEWHNPQARFVAHWRDVEPIANGTMPPEPFFARVNSNDCIEFYHTNLLPNVYEMNDFHIRAPTDVVGQHVHLLKFDLTSSDGSASGWNYEDGTLSPLEVRERIAAINAGQGGLDGRPLVARMHPFFGGVSLAGVDVSGAQTTVQRWYADRTMNNSGEDRTLGTANTHDHLGLATHQQAGLYGFLGVEPDGSTWRNPETGERFGGRDDGGPTSFRADIIAPDGTGSFREFFMFVAGLQQAYARGRLNPATDRDQPGNPVVGYANPELVINPPVIEGSPLSSEIRKAALCKDLVHAPPCPEAIVTADVGTMTVNFRNEPLALRLLNTARNGQAAGQAGDLAYVYRSDVKREIPELNGQPDSYSKSLTEGLFAGDPYTPLLRANQGDKLLIRLGGGVGERSHSATIHGFRWLLDPRSINSGWKNAQAIEDALQLHVVAPIVAGEHSGNESVDYLYKFGAAESDQWNGTWGLVRVYDQDGDNRLLPLPDNLPRSQAIANADEYSGVCPKQAPVRKWEVTAVTAADALPSASGYGIDLTRVPGVGADVGTLVYNGRGGAFASGAGPLHDPTSILYVRTSDLDASGKLLPGAPIEPLILRAAAGECVEVTLHNSLPPGQKPLVDLPGAARWPLLIEQFNANEVAGTKQVGLHPQLLSFDGSLHDGTNVGGNRGIDGQMLTQTVGPGETITYRWYAGILSMRSDNRLVATPVEFGATGLIPADALKQPGKGLVGALIIEPQRARWVEDLKSRASALVRAQSERPFREHVVILQDGVNLLGKNGSPITPALIEDGFAQRGEDAMNYRSEPFWFRLGYMPRSSPKETNERVFSSVLSNAAAGGDAETPVFSSRARTPVRLRVVHPAMEGRNHVFSLHGHAWEWMPYVAHSMRVGSNPLSEWQGAQGGIGPYAHFDFALKNGAGGKFGVRGDYLLRDQNPFTFSNGMWGILRVQ